MLSQECELVMLMSSVRGRLDLTTTHASFHDLSPFQEDGERQDFKVGVTHVTVPRGDDNSLTP